MESCPNQMPTLPPASLCYSDESTISRLLLAWTFELQLKKAREGQYLRGKPLRSARRDPPSQRGREDGKRAQ